MDRKPLLWIVVVVVTLIAGWKLASAQGEKEKAVQRWEHKTYMGQNTDNREVTQLGKEGWELVAVEPAMPYVQSSSTVRRTERFFYFKRQL